MVNNAENVLRKHKGRNRVNSKRDTIVLINGLWMTALSWEHWVKYYTPANLTTSLPLQL